MTSPSALVSVSRLVAFGFGVNFARNKKAKIKQFVEEENFIKLKQLEEMGIDSHSLKGASFHIPKIHDPWYTANEIKTRERRPSYFLNPADEFAYQTKIEREKLAKLYQQKTLIARSLAKEKQSGYHSVELEEVTEVDPKEIDLSVEERY
ncbi:hypothetical protein MHBO_004287 [Bonamia ostreae]|uniref:Uncharacterized protein n=1 Tax=Bonamia ostreae TaxID=126728 RepID=A0ABV2ATK7_9EUKA